MRNIAIHIALLICSSIAIADDSRPTMGRVFNESEDSKIQYSCSLKSAVLECDFVQVSLSVRMGKEEAEKSVQDALAEFRKAGDPSFNKQCAEVKNFEEYLKQYASRTYPKRLESFVDWLSTLEKYCANSSIASYEKILRIHFNEQANTCVINTHSFQQKFQKNSSGDWLVMTEPDRRCGLVYLDKFESDGANEFKSWNYVTRKVVTNKKGSTLLGGSCSMYDEKEYRWNWRKRAVGKDCEFVELE